MTTDLLPPPATVGNPFIDALSRNISSLEEKRKGITDKVVEEKRDALTPEETVEFDRITGELDSARARVKEMAGDITRAQETDEILKGLVGLAETGGARVTSEPMTYRRGGQFSYFGDLANSRRPDSADPKAAERLSQHAREVEIESRANMNLTDGTGGEFVPPLWLMSEYLPLARAGRVAAELCRKMALPPNTDSINIPSVATGTAVATQTIGGSVQKTDMTTSSVSASVITKAGQQVFPMQLLDQSPINMDEVVFADLLAALAVQVDAYVLSAASIGVLNVSGANDVTYTDASPTVPELYPKVANGIQQVHTTRFLPPQAHLMHPRRWAWHLAALDSSNRPLVVPNAQGPQNAFAGMENVRSEGAVGTLQGLPVYVDANVPINLGAGTNQDAIVTARWDDLYLWESSVRTRVLFETDADTLSVRLQVWEYLAFMAGRYPTAISRINGTGLVTPTF